MYKLIPEKDGSFRFIPFEREPTVNSDICQTIACRVWLFYRFSKLPKKVYDCELSYNAISHYLNDRLISITYSNNKTIIKIYED